MLIKNRKDVKSVKKNVNGEFKSIVSLLKNINGEFKEILSTEPKYYHVAKKERAYYDLGEIITPEKTIEIDINFSIVTGNLIFGSRFGYNAPDSYAIYQNRFDVGKAGDFFSGIFPEQIFCTIKLSDKKLYVNNELMVAYSENSLTTQTLSSYLFDVNTNGLPTGSNETYVLEASTKLYDVRIYNEDGTIKHNYEPQPDQSRKCSITGKVLNKLGTGNFDVVEDTQEAKILERLGVQPPTTLSEQIETLNNLGVNV